MKKFALSVFALFALICHGILWEDVADSKKVVFSANDPFGLAISSNLQVTVAGIPAIAGYGTNTANRFGVFAADTSNKFSIVSGRLDDHSSTLQGLATRIDSTETRQTAVEASFTETRVSVTGISSSVSTALQTSSNALTKAEQALAVVPGPDEPMVRSIVASLIEPVSNIASNALSRPVGVSSGYVASVVSTTRVSRVESADTSGAYNQFSGSEIYQTTITPAIPKGGFTFSAGFSANGVPPPLNLISGIPNGGWAVYRSPVSPFGYTLKYGTCEWGPATAATDGNGHAVLVFASNGAHGEVGIATNWLSAVAAVTNIVIYRLSEASAADLIAEHNGETSSHNGRITALENRPAGVTTNTVFPFVTFSDPYGSNTLIRVVVSNGTFIILGAVNE